MQMSLFKFSKMKSIFLRQRLFYFAIFLLYRIQIKSKVSHRVIVGDIFDDSA